MEFDKSTDPEEEIPPPAAGSPLPPAPPDGPGAPSVPLVRFPKRAIACERRAHQTGLAGAIDEDAATERGAGSSLRARFAVVPRDSTLYG